MTKRLMTCAAIAALTCMPVQAATLSDVFTSFYVLGDSNSDFGNLGDFGPPPPYFIGQFSNGPVWADILDDQFETGDPDDIRTWNYAFGGARVTETSDVPDLPSQLGLFGADLDPTVDDPLPGTPVLGDRPLVSIWFGANDIRGIYQEYEAAVDAAAGLDDAARLEAEAMARAAAQAAASGVGALYGATLENISRVPQFGDLLSFNTADSGATPEYPDPADSLLLTELSALFNSELDASLGRIMDQGVNVYSVDIFGLQQQVRADPAAFGLSNATDACLTFTLTGPVICDDPNSYLYWDEVGHLSGAAHAALAGIVEETVLSAAVTPIPLPASLPALGAGLGLLGLLRWRGTRSPA
jgi:outer membrane lipase/esterase